MARALPHQALLFRLIADPQPPLGTNGLTQPLCAGPAGVEACGHSLWELYAGPGSRVYVIGVEHETMGLPRMSVRCHCDDVAVVLRAVTRCTHSGCKHGFTAENTRSIVILPAPSCFIVVLNQARKPQGFPALGQYRDSLMVGEATFLPQIKWVNSIEFCVQVINWTFTNFARAKVEAPPVVVCLETHIGQH